MMALCRAARPIPARIANGVPAAIPQAPATMMTEIVETGSRDEEGERAQMMAKIHQ
jgi:hypothetical protein